MLILEQVHLYLLNPFLTNEVDLVAINIRLNKIYFLIKDIFTSAKSFFGS